MARWDGEAEEALKRAGFEIIDYAGVDDWQGWGVYLAKQGEEYAVLSWSYGSCSGCDAYEDLSEEERAKEFYALIERGLSEVVARAKFADGKGW